MSSYFGFDRSSSSPGRQKSPLKQYVPLQRQRSWAKLNGEEILDQHCDAFSTRNSRHDTSSSPRTSRQNVRYRPFAPSNTLNAEAHDDDCGFALRGPLHRYLPPDDHGHDDAAKESSSDTITNVNTQQAQSSPSQHQRHLHEHPSTDMTFSYASQTQHPRHSHTQKNHHRIQLPQTKLHPPEHAPPCNVLLQDGSQQNQQMYQDEVQRAETNLEKRLADQHSLPPYALHKPTITTETVATTGTNSSFSSQMATTSVASSPTFTKNDSREEQIGEMQVQIDQYHAQILTLQMNKKYSEDQWLSQEKNYQAEIGRRDKEAQRLQNLVSSLQHQLMNNTVHAAKQKDSLIAELEKTTTEGDLQIHDLHNFNTLLKSEAQACSTLPNDPFSQGNVKEKHAAQAERLYKSSKVEPSTSKGKKDDTPKQLMRTRFLSRKKSLNDNEALESRPKITDEEEKTNICERKLDKGEEEMWMLEVEQFRKENDELHFRLKHMGEEMHVLQGRVLQASLSNGSSGVLVMERETLIETEQELRLAMEKLAESERETNELKEDVDRLEMELEVVTEDRDELLRRSVVTYDGILNKRPTDDVGCSSKNLIRADAQMLQVPIKESCEEGKKRDQRIPILNECVVGVLAEKTKGKNLEPMLVQHRKQHNAPTFDGIEVSRDETWKKKRSELNAIRGIGAPKTAKESDGNDNQNSSCSLNRMETGTKYQEQPPSLARRSLIIAAAAAKAAARASPEKSTQLEEDNKSLCKVISEDKIQIQKLEKRCTQLKVCLEDAMQELKCADTEEQSRNELNVQQNRSNFQVADLSQILDEKNEEILRLKRLVEAEKSSLAPSDEIAVSDASAEGRDNQPKQDRELRCELQALLQWLDSSPCFERENNVSPERVLRGEAIWSHELQEPSFASRLADPVAKMIYHHIWTAHSKFISIESKLKTIEHKLKKMKDEEDIPAPPSPPALIRSFETLSESTNMKAISHPPYLDLSILDAAETKVLRLEEEVAVLRNKVKENEAYHLDMRRSLKEALDLVKPLKDHVSNTEEEKRKLHAELMRLQDQLDESEREKEEWKRKGMKSANNGADSLGDEAQVTAALLQEKDDEIAELQEEVNELFGALRDAKSVLKRVEKERIAIKTPPVSPGRSIINSSHTKRLSSSSRNGQSSSEEADSQLREATLKSEKANDDLIECRNEKLNMKSLLDDASRLNAVKSQQSNLFGEKAKADEQSKASGITINSMKAELALTKEGLWRAEDLLRLRSEPFRLFNDSLDGEDGTSNPTAEQFFSLLETLNARANELEVELSTAKCDLKAKQDSERTLSKSLKEALGLLKSMQTHIETVEKEKKELKTQLRAKYVNSEPKVAAARSEASSSGSVRQVKEYESWIDRMRKEKAALELRLSEFEKHFDLDDEEVGDNVDVEDACTEAVKKNQKKGKAVVKSEERLVEMNSLYEVTKVMLDEASETNKTLLDALKRMQSEEIETAEELEILKKKLIVAQQEIDNAKFIAVTALVKISDLAGSDYVSLFSGESSGGSRIIPEETDETESEDKEGSSSNKGGGTIASGELKSLIECIETLEGQVCVLMEKNSALEELIQVKNDTIRNLLEGNNNNKLGTEVQPTIGK